MDKRVKASIVSISGLIFLILNEVILKTGTFFSVIGFGVAFISAFMIWINDMTDSM